MDTFDPRNLDRLRLDAAESTSAALGVVDASGRIVWHNRQLSRWLGYRPSELVGEYLTCILAEPNPSEILALLNRPGQIEARAPRSVRFRGRNGTVVDAVIDVALTGTAAVPFTIITILGADAIRCWPDISQQLDRVNRLDVANRLVGAILHDFNNLLAGISGHARLAKECSSQQETDAALDEVLKATDRCSQLVNRLRGGAQNGEPEPEGVLWQPIVGEAISLIRGTLPANVQVRLSLDGAPAAAYCTASEAHQIVMNLGLNAIDALGERGGTLAVSFRTEWLDGANAPARPGISPGQYVCLVVQDDGCGMDESTRISMFEPFFSTKSTGSHRGLGLAIVHELVQRRRGFVEVDSQLGYGTRFRVYLPTVRA